MAQAPFSDASPNAHLLIGEMPAPRQLRGRWWEGTGLSVAAHAVAFGILFYAATHVPQVVQTASAVTEKFKIVFLDSPGPSGSGSGDGKTSGPPRPAESTAARPVQMKPIPNPADAHPPPEMTIPVITAQALQMLPGAVAQVDTTSSGGLGGPGPGRGPGRGPGSGPGDGRGFGPGGDQVFGVGNGVVPPVLTREVKPSYTGDAMRAKVQGVVDMEAVVLPDGSIDPASIRITRSLDSTFGLDQQAIVAVKQWHFRPGTFKGQPVAVRVSIELAFTLR